MQFVTQFLIYLSSWIRLYCHDFGIHYFSILPACLDISLIDLKMKYPCRTSDIMSLDLWCLLFYDRALLVWSIPYFTHFLPLFCLCPSSHGKLKQKRVWKKFLCRGFLLHCWLVISTTVTLPILWYYTSFFFDCRHISIEKRILCSTYCSIENASKFIKFLWNTLVRFLFRSS